MATAKQIKQNQKNKVVNPLLNQFDEEVENATKEDEYYRSLANSLDFQRFVLLPAKKRLSQAREMRIEDVGIRNDDDLRTTSSKVAKKLVYNQGYVDGILAVLGEFIEE